MEWFISALLAIILILVYALWLRKLTRNASYEIISENNSQFCKEGTVFRIIKENRFQELLIKEKSLDRYFQSWMASRKISNDGNRPYWLVNDFAEIVYRTLCSTDGPEDISENWEGWVANKLGVIHEQIISEKVKTFHESSVQKT